MGSASGFRRLNPRSKPPVTRNRGRSLPAGSRHPPCGLEIGQESLELVPELQELAAQALLGGGRFGPRDGFREVVRCGIVRSDPSSAVRSAASAVPLPAGGGRQGVPGRRPGEAGIRIRLIWPSRSAIFASAIFFLAPGMVYSSS